MNRSLYALLIFVLGAAVALADPPDEDVLRPHVEGRSRWFFELDGGVNLNYLAGNPEFRSRNELEGITNIFESATGISPLLGLTVGYELNPHFALTFGAAYDARWTSNSGTVADTCVLRDISDPNLIVGRSPVDVDKQYDADVDYLSLSLLARITFRRLFFYIGPTVSLPISATVSETDHIIDDSSTCTYAPFTTASSKTTSGSLSGSIATLRISAKLGIGYEIPIDESWSVVPQVGIDVGLTDTFKQNQQMVLGTDTGVSTGAYTVNPAAHINSLQVVIGLQYHL